MTTAMTTMQKKNFSSPDETRPIPKLKLEIVKFGDSVVGRATFEPGWKWSECVKPIAGTDSCEASHFGYCLSGRMHCVMKDGTAIDIGPGDAFLIPPGHDAWILGEENCVMLDFAGAEHYAQLH